MARSAALNPASMPFFPGSLRGNDDEDASGLGFSQHGIREHDRVSFSSHSVSASDYISARSSPSPPTTRTQELRNQSSPGPRDIQRQSPTLRQNDAGKPYPGIEARTIREGSMLGTLGTLPENEDPLSSNDPDSVSEEESGNQTPGSFYTSRPQAPPLHESFSASSTSFHPNVVAPSVSGASYASASPVSSQDSNARFTPSVDHQQMMSFESQLKASPMIHDILERLVRTEYTQREIQREIIDINRKVNLLVDAVLSTSNGQPEFKDPFATNNATPPNLRSRPSIGNIAPNQPASSDDISTISQRLNTLTSSVGQLLAIQTKQYQQQNAIVESRNNSIIGLNGPPVDIPPGMMSPSASGLGHGLPNRPDIRGSRQSSGGGRGWSVPNLDLPIRPNEMGGVGGRPEVHKPRRSVVRRDSSGVDSPDWPGGAPRDSGPLISKWEQLSLAPELLRSLTKFGVGPPNKIQQRALPFLLKGADIIAQAPPTQERIAAYVIPAIQVAVTAMNALRGQIRGPIVIMISTTVDQATQAQRMIKDLGGPINVRSALGVGAGAGSSELAQELRILQQNMPHIICGTPQKLHALFTTPGGLPGSDVRFLVLDEVDQLIARNLHEFVFSIVKLLPLPRSRPLPSGGGSSGGSTSGMTSPPPSSSVSQTSFTSPFDTVSPFQNTGRRFSSVASPSPLDNNPPTTPTPTIIERQTALFSNTVPQDVLNLASAIQLREPVRVLVRRDGNVSNPETTQQTRGLRQFYLYLAFTAGGRSDPSAINPGGGLGIIGSGRSATSAETAQAREWKLDALADIFGDVEVNQAIVHVGGMNALESVVYKLASHGFEAVPLHGDMNTGTKVAALNKFRNPTSVVLRQPSTKVLVVYDVQLKSNEVPHVPLVINYDLPKAVEEYSNRVSPAIASTYARAGVVVNFVTATGGDVEMLRSIECFYKIKCPEVPVSLRDIV